MKYAIAVYYNVGGSREPVRDYVPMMDGYRSHSPLERSIITLDVEALDVDSALGQAWEYYNADDRPNGKLERSLSVGDVIVIRPESGSVGRLFAVDRVGFTELTSDDVRNDKSMVFTA